jgi:hypothetical protein
VAAKKQGSGVSDRKPFQKRAPKLKLRRTKRFERQEQTGDHEARNFLMEAAYPTSNRRPRCTLSKSSLSPCIIVSLDESQALKQIIAQRGGGIIARVGKTLLHQTIISDFCSETVRKIRDWLWGLSRSGREYPAWPMRNRR